MLVCRTKQSGDAGEAGRIEVEGFAMFGGAFDAPFEEIEVEVLGAPGEAARDDLGARVVDGAAHGTVAKVLQ